jgi:hypothetical protein
MKKRWDIVNAQVFGFTDHNPLQHTSPTPPYQGGATAIPPLTKGRLGGVIFGLEEIIIA